jgi:hypothetical protein
VTGQLGNVPCSGGRSLSNSTSVKCSLITGVHNHAKLCLSWNSKSDHSRLFVRSVSFSVCRWWYSFRKVRPMDWTSYLDMRNYSLELQWLIEIQGKIPKHVTYCRTSLGRLQLCLTRIVIGEEQVPQQGLKVPFRDGLLKHVAQDVFKLAKVCSSLVVLHYFQFEGFDFMRLMFIPATAL